MVVAAIAEGNTGGQLWVAEFSGVASVALLWDKGNNVLYAVGSGQTSGVPGALQDLLWSTVRPQALAEHSPYFSLCLLSDAQAGPSLLPQVTLQPAAKHFYRFVGDSAPTLPAPDVDGLELAAIDGELLSRDLPGVDEIRREVEWMWPSLPRFLARGIGVAALAGGDVACWCTSEYVSQAACGIGIATAPAFQVRGLATYVTAHFIAASLERGMVPHWECDSRNAASIRVAEKAGFTLLGKRSVWEGDFRG